MNDTETIEHGSAEAAPGPDRVVDARMVGWWRVGPISGGAVDAPAGYACAETLRSSQPHLSLAELEAAHGPLRVVEPMSQADTEAIADALRSAGHKAVTTLAAALGEVWEDTLERYAAADEAAGLAHSERDVDKARRALVAGRPMSWEADLLCELTYFGRGLLYGSRSRIDSAALPVLREVISRAVDEEGPHHELAETLGVIVTQVADEVRADGGVGGWDTVVDQWLRPGSLAADDAHTAYRLLYATSPFYEPTPGR